MKIQCVIVILVAVVFSCIVTGCIGDDEEPSRSDIRIENVQSTSTYSGIQVDFDIYNDADVDAEVQYEVTVNGEQKLLETQIVRANANVHLTKYPIGTGTGNVAVVQVEWL